MVVTCPHCKISIDTDQAAYVANDVILCEHCGNEFNVPRDADRKNSTIDSLYREASVPPYRIRISAADSPGHPALARASGKTPARRAHHPVATMFWTLGILLLSLGLAAQYAYFMRGDLARHPPLRPWLEQLCSYAGCEIPLMRAPAQIRIVGRDVRRHPAATDALLVSITFSNQAPYTQAYPVIQLSFFNIRDQILARRRFAPHEYLSQNMDPAAGMPAGIAIQAVLEVVDPGADAVNFTFDFL